MLKEEFESRINTTINEEDWKLVNFVYTWHPNIKDVGGKDQIADIYKVGGIELIKDMRNAAVINCEYENEIQELRRQMSQIEEEISELKNEKIKKLNTR